MRYKINGEGKRTLLQKEIGSTYWLDPKSIEGLPMKSIKSPHILGADESYVSSCRTGIGLALDELRANNKVALLPAFTCESVLDPFVKRGYEVHPYRIDKSLSINPDSFIEDVRRYNPSVVLVHPYFGFDTTNAIRDVIQPLRQEGIIFIADMTQSMFSSFKPLRVNYYVGSIRKWMPIPDGAFTTAINRNTEEDEELVDAKLKALTEKGDWILNQVGSKEQFRQDFVKAERILDSRMEAFSMSSVSRELYDRTDIAQMKQQRYDNYFHLQHFLTSDAVLRNNLDSVLIMENDKVCPFHYCVYVKEGRKELQQYLASKDIYATVIWACPKEFESEIDEICKYIYEHILCFHIDQRYSEMDTERIVKELKEYYSNI